MADLLDHAALELRLPEHGLHGRFAAAAAIPPPAMQYPALHVPAGPSSWPASHILTLMVTDGSSRLNQETLNTLLLSKLWSPAYSTVS